MDFRRFLEDLEGSLERRAENLVVFSRLESTASLVREVVREYLDEDEEPPSLLLVAWEQTGGRGRQGRTWMSPPGKGIYASLLLPGLERASLGMLPLAAGVGLSAGLGGHLSRPCRLKWPNDLMLEDRKLGGVLIESVSRAEDLVAVLSFGVNRAQEEGELPGKGATSIALAEGTAPPPGPLLADLLEGLRTWLGASAEALVAEYRRRSLHQRGDRLRCRVAGERIEGVFQEIDEGGRLCLSVGGGERRLSGAEVVESW